MLCKSTRFFILSLMILTNTIQTTKTAQHNNENIPTSFLAQFNLLIVPQIQQIVTARLQEHETRLANMMKMQDIFWASKTLDFCIKNNKRIEESDIIPLDKCLAQIKRTNNASTSTRLLKRQRYIAAKLKRQRYIAAKLANLRTKMLLSEMAFFDSEEVS